MPLSQETKRVLDIDIENRPLNYVGSDFTNSEITALGWSHVGEDRIEFRLLGLHDPYRYLAEFADAFNEADIVTGHYILKHDLLILNGAMLEHGFPPLKQTYISDTYMHVMKRLGISISQENLADMLEVPAEKLHMSQADWRSANRLEPAGIEKARKRVTGDVLQHKYVREALIKRGWLKSPTLWKP